MMVSQPSVLSRFCSLVYHHRLASCFTKQNIHTSKFRFSAFSLSSPSSSMLGCNHYHSPLSIPFSCISAAPPSHSPRPVTVTPLFRGASVLLTLRWSWPGLLLLCFPTLCLDSKHRLHHFSSSISSSVSAPVPTLSLRTSLQIGIIGSIAQLFGFLSGFKGNLPGHFRPSVCMSPFSRSPGPATLSDFVLGLFGSVLATHSHHIL